MMKVDDTEIHSDEINNPNQLTSIALEMKIRTLRGPNEHPLTQCFRFPHM